MVAFNVLLRKLMLEYCQLCGCHCQRRWLQWWVVGGSQQPLSNVKVWQVWQPPLLTKELEELPWMPINRGIQ